MTSNSLQVAAWLVDLDGTLYKPGAMKLATGVELALLGAASISTLSAFRKIHETLREEQLLDPAREFLPNAFEEQIRRAAAGAGLPEERIRHAVSTWMIHRPGRWIRLFRRTTLLDRIAAFRAEGGKTALVSDYPAAAKLAALGAVDLFDCVVASGEHARLTRLKPAPDAFLLAAEELGVAPDACLVLGDRDDADGAASRAAGMQFELVR
jgi:putative hydrolase of the HAD superfamily